jgi:hypothetical protein
LDRNLRDLEGIFNATILVRAGVPGRRRVPNATACAGRAVVWPLSQNDRARRSRG